MRKRARIPGFTLIELLVAMAVLCLLVVMLFSMVEAATRLWKDNENRVDAYREARAALNVITDDLRNILSSTDTNFFSTNTIGTKSADASDTGLFFLTSMPKSGQPANNVGDVCAVGYYLQFAKQNSGFGGTNAADPTQLGYQLFRSIYGSDLTYTNVATGSSPLNNLASPTSSGGPDAEILARNIVSMSVSCYQTNASGFQPWAYSVTTPMPQMIEVKLVAISDEAAKRLGGLKANWTTNNAVVSSSMRTFVSRLQVPKPIN